MPELSAAIASGIILTMSAEPLGDLRGGPLRLLLLLRKLAGQSRRLTTYTQSLATLCGKCANTIRAWRNELVEQGYIHAATSPRTGQTTILIREKVEPPSRQAMLAEQRRIDALPAPLPWQPPRPQAMKPDPKPWWRPPFVVNWRAKSATSEGGAQFSAPIKTTRIRSDGISEEGVTCHRPVR